MLWIKKKGKNVVIHLGWKIKLSSPRVPNSPPLIEMERESVLEAHTTWWVCATTRNCVGCFQMWYFNSCWKHVNEKGFMTFYNWPLRKLRFERTGLAQNSTGHESQSWTWNVEFMTTHSMSLLPCNTSMILWEGYFCVTTEQKWAFKKQKVRGLDVWPFL